MTVQLLAVGKLAKNYLKEGVQDYSRRIRRHCKFEIIEIASSSAGDPRPAEAALLLPRLGQTYCIVLNPGETIYNSQELAAQLQALQNRGLSHFTFVIGGSHGLDETVKQRADMSLSFSPLTFPHQLFRLMFCEQLYRCLKINSGQTYHK